MFANPSLFVSRLLFIGLIIEAFEIFRLRQFFNDNEMFSRSTIAILTKGIPWPMRIGATVGKSRAIAFAVGAQAIAAMLVIIRGTHTPEGILAVLICLITNGYLRARHQIGSSGAEQLIFIVLVTFGLVILAGGTDSARRVGDAFIAAQVVLAYLASGISKMVSPIWRNGGAIAGILSTEGYGVSSVAKLLMTHPDVGRLLCWSVMVWEITFPVALIAPKALMISILVVGLIFHVSCAVAMGLNRFVWAFCGCYPAVWATAMLLR